MSAAAAAAERADESLPVEEAVQPMEMKRKKSSFEKTFRKLSFPNLRRPKKSSVFGKALMMRSNRHFVERRRRSWWVCLLSTKSRQRIYQFIDDPNSSRGAFIFCFCMLTLIIMSVIVLILRETPHIDFGKKVMNRMELSFNIIFTLEIVLRFSIVEEPWRSLDVYLVFDLLSALPFWVNLALKYRIALGSSKKLALFVHFEKRRRQFGPLRKFREMFRALRMLRLLKLTRRYDGSIVILQSLSDSAAALTGPICFLLGAVVFGGALLYTVEVDQPTKEIYEAKEHRFHSALHAVWFMVVTFLTVGFGDTYPVTIQGKVLTTIAMFVGIFTMAMIYAIVGNNFVRVWEQKDQVIFLKKLKEHFHHMSVTRADVEQTFKELDEDGSGALDFLEFCSALSKIDVMLTDKRKKALWAALDYNHQGEIKM